MRNGSVSSEDCWNKCPPPLRFCQGRPFFTQSLLVLVVPAQIRWLGSDSGNSGGSGSGAVLFGGVEVTEFGRLARIRDVDDRWGLGKNRLYDTAGMNSSTLPGEGIALGK